MSSIGFSHLTHSRRARRAVAAGVVLVGLALTGFGSTRVDAASPGAQPAQHAQPAQRVELVWSRCRPLSRSVLTPRPGRTRTTAASWRGCTGRGSPTWTPRSKVLSRRCWARWPRSSPSCSSPRAPLCWSGSWSAAEQGTCRTERDDDHDDRQLTPRYRSADAGPHRHPHPVHGVRRLGDAGDRRGHGRAVEPLHDRPLLDVDGYGLPALQANHWWTVVAGAFFGLTPAEYVPVVGGFVLLVGFAASGWAPAARPR